MVLTVASGVVIAAWLLRRQERQRERDQRLAAGNR